MTPSILLGLELGAILGLILIEVHRLKADTKKAFERGYLMGAQQAEFVVKTYWNHKGDFRADFVIPCEVSGEFAKGKI